jgi:hypothetical protein
MNSADQPLATALKEWAAICAALAHGRQSVLFRKGGIAEEHGAFRLEHTRFWLYPTYVHQQESGLRPDWADLLRTTRRPDEHRIHLSHWALVTRALHVADLDAVLRLAPLQGCSEATVRQRFAYREPGLHVLAVRVYQAPSPHDIPEIPVYLGCKSWVPLASSLDTAGSQAVLDDAEHARRQAALDALAATC